MKKNRFGMKKLISFRLEITNKKFVKIQNLITNDFLIT